MHPRFFPEHLHFGPFEGIPAYGTMLALGFLAALWVALRLARRVGLHPDRIWDLWIACLLGGIAGARIWFVVQFSEEFFTDGKFDVLGLFRMWNGGLVYYGGFLGALVASGIYMAVTRTKPGQVFDAVTAPVALGLGFGRVGCFLNGCCWGQVCKLPWAVRFPNVTYTIDGIARHSLAFEQQRYAGLVGATDAWSLPVHPTQLYAMAANWIIFAILILHFRRRKARGEMLPLFLVLYGAQRFIVEFFRGDNYPAALGLSLAQFTSIGMFVAGLMAFLILRLRLRSHPEAAADSAS